MFALGADGCTSVKVSTRRAHCECDHKQYNYHHCINLALWFSARAVACGARAIYIPCFLSMCFMHESCSMTILRVQIIVCTCKGKHSRQRCVPSRI